MKKIQTKKLQTLKSKNEFDFVYKNSKKYRSDIFDICVLEEKLLKRFYTRFDKIPSSLVGLSVSKKVGSAVKRNLIKRRLRSICRGICNNSINSVFIIIVKAKILQTPFSTLEKNLHKIFQ